MSGFRAYLMFRLASSQRDELAWFVDARPYRCFSVYIVESPFCCGVDDYFFVWVDFTDNTSCKSCDSAFGTGILTGKEEDGRFGVCYTPTIRIEEVDIAVDSLEKCFAFLAV